MTDQHLSSQFDVEMDSVATKVRVMGDLALSILERSMAALFRFDKRAARDVQTMRSELHTLEMEADGDIAAVIALRQPAARDLRLLFAASKLTSTLARIGDLCGQIAATVEHLQDGQVSGDIGTPITLVQSESTRVTGVLHNAVQAFARRDLKLAVQVLKEEPGIEGEVTSLLHQLVRYMIESPQALSAGIDLVAVAKAIESINVEVKHFAQVAIYAICGEDVRGTPPEGLAAKLASA